MFLFKQQRSVNLFKFSESGKIKLSSILRNVKKVKRKCLQYKGSISIHLDLRI